MKPATRAHDALAQLERQPLLQEHRQRQTLNVDLGELKPLVEATSKNQGKRPAAFVREAVALALQEHQAVPVRLPSVAANRRPGAEVVNFGGRLTLAQSEALRSAAAAEGLSQIEFVAAVAEGALSPPLRLRTMEALAELTTRLQAVELELHALARRVPDAAQVDVAVREVRAQARRAAEVLDDVSTSRRKAARRANGA
jgi:hypothetical protein